MLRKIAFITLLLLLTIGSVFSQNENSILFNKATKDYNDGKFQAAADAYSKILKSGEASASLYYNLANANYKLNKVGESIYYYEKAFQLSPNDSDIKNNLEFAKRMKIDAITPLPKTFIEKLHYAVTGLFSIDTWAILSIIAVVLLTISFLLYFFSGITLYKRIYFIACCIFFVFSVATVTIAYYKNQDLKNNKQAIVFEKIVHVYSEPNSYSQELFVLHEGTKVQILEKLSDWNKIRLADGKIGWAKTSTMKML